MRTNLVCAAMLALSPAIAYAAAEQRIGTWVISCPEGSRACLMRFSKRFVDKAGITADLEVESQGAALVPVLVLRGLSSEILLATAMAGTTDVSLQFSGGARQQLNCNASNAAFVCAPNEAAGRLLSAALPAARSVTVRVGLSVTGMSPLPAQERSLDLSGTTEALARLRAAGPSPVPNPLSIAREAARSPAGMMAMADKMLKSAGYQQGLAGAQALIAKYMNK
jgi:hypothetical protein